MSIYSNATNHKKLSKNTELDRALYDAFSRLRVSNPATLFDSTNQYDTSPLIFRSKLSDNATEEHLPDESGVLLTVPITTDESAIRQSKEYFRYQPGKSQLIKMTFAFGETEEFTEKRVGYFDGENGIFLLNRGGNISIVRRSKVSGAVVDTEVAQADWNIDKMDGSGQSKLDVDFTKALILVIDLEWLGTGDVRVGLGIHTDESNLNLVYCHKFKHSGIIGTTYMTTANLPVRFEIKTTDQNTAEDTFRCYCSEVNSEGGVQDPTGYPFCLAREELTATSTTAIPLLSIRPKELFNSITTRGRFLDVNYSAVGAEQTHIIQIIYNGTLTGAVWADVNSDHSFTEYDISATAITGGIVIACGYIGKPATGAASINTVMRDALQKLTLNLDIDGTNADVLTIAAKTLTGTGTAAVSLNWIETR